MAIGMAQRVFSKTGRRMAILATACVAGGSTLYALNQPLAEAKMIDHDLIGHPPVMDWSHKKMFKSFDHASIRRGWEVYKQVCAACHSLKYVHYRSMVDVFLTEDEAKAEAADVIITDGPNDEGKMFERPGTIRDKVPNPYPNEEAARAANNGAYPPDLSVIVLARHNEENYIFSLLTGYVDPPAGVNLDEGQHFNAYFPDGAISMAKALYDDVIEYSDGTPASASQMAKDVTTFLAWCAMPEHDERKLISLKVLALGLPVLAAAWYWKRHTWIQIKTRKIMMKQ